MSYAANLGRDRSVVHVRRDPTLLSRTFAHEEIYPSELGCLADQSLALQSTPPAGATLLHMCVDYDEMEIHRCARSMAADAGRQRRHVPVAISIQLASS